MQFRLRVAFMAPLVAVALVAAPGAAAGQKGKAGAAHKQKQASALRVKECFPACRSGYVCHPQKLECVSVCNPPCANDEICTEEATCVPNGRPIEPDLPELGDRRFRFVLLGRFGVAGKLTLGFNEFGLESEQSARPDKATTGFELRFEKPLARYFSLGGLLSNYFIRPESGYEYALDIAPYIKPRVPFRIGKQEGEVYLVVHFGMSVLALRSINVSAMSRTRIGHIGFNVAASPGIQIFIGNVALVFEVGYAYSWFRIEEQDPLRRFTLGQLTFRPGFAFRF